MTERQTKLLEQVSLHKRIEVTKLAAFLNVSQVTIRKDLSALEEQGLLKREHGFAVVTSNEDIAYHLAFDYETKLKIAMLAAQMVADGETVMIESGSCCALLAQELAFHKHGVTIITNSTFIADYIRKAPYAKIILLGGEYQNDSQVMLGSITRKAAAEFYVDKIFVGTDGFSETGGFTGNNLPRVETLRDMATRANNIIILTESAKFSRQGVVAQFALDDIQYVITDAKIDPKYVKLLTDHQVTVKKAAL